MAGARGTGSVRASRDLSTRCCRACELIRLDQARAFLAHDPVRSRGSTLGRRWKSVLAPVSIWRQWPGQEPAGGFIGCEVFLNGVAALLSDIDEAGLANVRIHDGDARDAARLAAGRVARPGLHSLPRSLAEEAPSQAPADLVPDTVGEPRACHETAAPSLKLPAIFPSYIRTTLLAVFISGEPSIGRRKKPTVTGASGPPGRPETRYERKAHYGKGGTAVI